MTVGIMSITPFGPDGEVDDDELRRHLRRFAGHPLSVYLCSQGSGEGLALTVAEKEVVCRAAVAVLGGRCELVGAGVGLTGGTDAALEQVERVSATGVDAVQVFPPRTGALRPRDREIERYFEEVIAAARCPVVLGENVTLVGYEIGVDLIRRILDRNDRVTGLSYTAPGSVGQLTELAASLAGRVAVRTGWLHHLPTMAAVGAAGVLCFDGNLVPGLVASVWDALREGRSDGPAALADLYAVNAVLSRFGNPASIKAALSHCGLPAGALRRPFLGLDERERAELARQLDRLRTGRGLDRWM